MAAIGAFTYRRKLTISTTAAGIGSDLTDFPLLVVVDSSSWTTAGNRTAFFDASNTNGKRVQFFAADQTTNLKYEVSKYDSGNQIAHYWVKAPTLGASTTIDFYVAYGNDPNSADQDDAANVWDAYFWGVYHMGDNQWGSSPEGKDSTSNARHTTNYGSTDAAGQVGQGRSFDAINDYCEVSSSGLPLGSDNRTVSLWLKQITDPGSNTWFMAYGDGSGTHLWAMGINANFTPFFSQYGGGYSGANTVSNTAFTYLALRNSGNTLYWRAGLTDSNSTSLTLATSRNTDTTLTFGKINYAAAYNNSILDEIRLHTIARPVDWLRAEYYSMFKTAWQGDGWLSWSAQEGGGSAGILRQMMAHGG